MPKHTYLSNNNVSPPLDAELGARENITKLRIGYPPKADGFEEIFHMKRNNITNETTVSGFCIDVFLATVGALTYHIDYEFIPFIDANGNRAGNYNDLVYQIYLQKYDAVVGDVAITANRSKYVDFTIPYTEIGLGTLAKRVEQKDMWIFLRPFDKNLWLTTLAFFIFTGFIVWVIEHPSNSQFQGSLSQQFGTVFSFTFSTLVFAHGDKLTSNLSKFVVVVWVFAVLILTSSYTATLSSLLTVQQIQQLKTRPGELIGYQDESFMSEIVNNLNFEDYELRPYMSMEEAYSDALSKGSKNGGADAIVDEIPYLKLFLQKYPNQYTIVKSTPITNGFGFAFRKGSPLVSDISREIAKLRESGELMKMEDKRFNSRSSLLSQDSVTNNPKTMDFNSFRGLFLITGLSSTSALLISCFTCFINIF